MAEPLKNLITRQLVADLAAAMALPDRFVGEASSGLEALDLKDRVRHVSATLAAHLAQQHGDYLVALDRAVGALPPPLPDDADLFAHTWVWPLTQWVEDHGRDHPARSVAALAEMTQRFTAEFAVRPYLQAEPDAVLAQLSAWVDHPSVHVRRWISEGTRPRLPWGLRLTVFVEAPHKPLALLERLVDDPEPYVRRSVANHLNDVAKDHPELVLDVAERWLRGAPEARRRTVRHALRTLLKQAHPRALALVGISPPRVVRAALRVRPEQVAIGGEVTLELEIELADDQELVLDYVVHHRRADGSTSPKVFHWARAWAARGVHRKDKRHSLRPVTTRRYYAGEHLVELRVNGQAVAEAAFTLVR